jgi:hypothetical protein
MEREASRFLGLLTPEQRKATLLSSDSSEKFGWHYVPKARLGVTWKQLSSAQRDAGRDLLRASLSHVGFDKIEQIRQLELVLRELEGGNPGRDPEDYHFLFFGEPSADKPWSWRYEGHHLSLSFACRHGKLVSSTPQFLGTNPASSKAGAPLAKEKELAFIFLDSLATDQLSRAVLSKDAPADIVSSNSRKASIEGRQGIPYRDLDQRQRKLLLDLIRAHAEVQTKAEEDRRLAAFRAEDAGRLVFAWMGSTQRKGPHYYRVQGDHMLIEYDNTQNDANHVHAVWRNLDEDFGEDLLEEHYEHGHHQHAH